MTDMQKTKKNLRVAQPNRKSHVRFYTATGRSIAAVACGAVLAVSLSACGVTVAQLPSTKTGSVEDSNASISQLDAAPKIDVDKAVVSLGDSWSIKVDGNEVASIKGQVIPIIGDTYSMFNEKGDLLASESEKKLTLFQSAALYDYNNKPDGELNRNPTLIMQKYSVTDSKGQTVATADQNLALTLNFDVKNKKGQVEYNISKAVFSLGASLSIEQKVKNPEVPAVDAIWIAVVANEISEAQSKSDDKDN
jgi:uncharacterized protein YxjI